MASRSDQACGACKKQKRRCDKGLPECSLCRRTGRPCEYGIAPDPLPTASDWASLQTRLSELENLLVGTPKPAAERSVLLSPTSASVSVASSAAALTPTPTPSTSSREPLDTHSTDLSSGPPSIRSAGATPAHSVIDDPSPRSGAPFPASMFLDIDCYIWSRARPPAPHGAIPPPVLALLSQGNVVLDVSQNYFSTVHLWFPMVSKKRMDLGLPMQNAGPDLAMLFLGMKLVTTPTTDDVADGVLYTTAKDFIARLESNGAISLLCLQAMVLIALALPPVIVPYWARLYVHPLSRARDPITTWTEAEERRRVWWSIFILDKLVSMGSRRRCLVPDPRQEDRLPVDDEAWNRGDVGRALSYSIRTPYEVQQSGFARLCQVSIYLARAISYPRDNQPMTISRVAEIMSLARELAGFGAALDGESAALGHEDRFAFLAPRSITRSALFVVLDRFTCPEKIGVEPGYVVDHLAAKTPEELELQQQSMRVIEMASAQLHTLSLDILATLGSEGGEAQQFSPGHVSPFIMDSIYASAATFHWIFGESGNDVYGTAAADLDRFLDALSSRWRLGAVYRDMLKVHDVSARIG
ncbi:uncharacterized protein DNG_06382 [Cephalotrichum gorgonifer]|uniref:Zn(2)-C6 fungal-type domain-containing protein n=1 Tax=Cephalotrichum gorgonifer TaxID=2041049 RepID=A0AAE8N1K1_9PEZI|nr:uncharacterized protein DNG_06382 [Cephalotrichum gorgonifer]